MAPAFCMVTDISPKKIEWAMKLRLCRMYTLQSFKDNKSVYSVECIFHDAEGSHIHATVKSPHIEKHQSNLKEYNLYAIQNFVVAANSPKSPTTGKYKIIFMAKTQLSEIFEENFPRNIFKFKTFQEISTFEVKDENIIFDVIGKLASKYSPEIKDIRGKPTKKLDIVLENIQGESVSCTLWEDFVDQVTNYLETSDDSIVIFILQMFRAKNFRGEVRLSNTFHVSKVIINENISEIHEFRDRLISDGKSLTPISNLSLTTSTTIEDDLESSKTLIRTIEQLHEIEEVGSYWVYGKIVGVETNVDWWYVSCKKCPKKMLPVAGTFFCDKCDVFDPTGNIRYMLQVRVVDDTGNAVFLIWDKESTQLIGKPANYLKLKSIDQTHPREFLNLVDMQVLFKIKILAGQHGHPNIIFPVVKLSTNKELINKYCEVQFDCEVSDIFSKMKEGDMNNVVDVNSSEDEVSTPLKDDKKKEDETCNIDESSSLKRTLLHEFSTTSKEKRIKHVIKEEKE